MLAPKTNNKKNIISILMLVAVLLIIFIVIYQNFIAGQKTDNKESKSVLGVLNTDIKTVDKIKKDKFDFDILNDSKLLNLVEFKYKRTPLSELKIGKDDPFKVDELLEVANKKVK